MNAIRQTALLNKRELENAVPPSASWHVDYRDTAWIYVGGFPLDLSEGDVVTIFSQFGSPTHLNLIRDKETGKSKGFGFLKYEDQRSCDLAVDNLGGADVLGRLLRVDHTRYKKREGEDEETYRIDRLEAETNGRADETESDEESRRKRRRLLKEEKELEAILAIKEDGEDEDPMRAYLIEEKREEVERAKVREQTQKRKHHHRSRYRDEEDVSSKGRRGGHDHRRRESSPPSNDNGPRRHRRQDHAEGQRRVRTQDKEHGRERRRSPSPSPSRSRSRSRSRSFDISRRRRREQASRSPKQSDDAYYSGRRSRSPRRRGQ